MAPPPVDPANYPIDTDRYATADLTWLDELDALTVHAGAPHQRMGTRGIDERDWLRADEHRVAELALRRRLVVDAPGEVYAAIDGSAAAAEEAAELVHRWLRTARPDLLDGWHAAEALGLAPLAHAGVAVQEDLCVMQPRDGAWVLAAALLCFPTYWRLADKLGLDRQKMFDVVSTSSGYSWSMNAYCPAPGVGPKSPADNDYKPGFAAELMLKDLRLSQQAAESADADTPMGELASALYARFVEDEDGKGRDFSAMLPRFTQRQRKS